MEMGTYCTSGSADCSSRPWASVPDLISATLEPIRTAAATLEDERGIVVVRAFCSECPCLSGYSSCELMHMVEASRNRMF